MVDPDPDCASVLALVMDRVEAEYSLTSLGNFHSPDNGFWALTVKTRGHREPVTVVGCAATAAGVGSPRPAKGIEKYLRSGMIRGIRRVYALKLEQTFNDKALDVIETEPERLREVPASARSAPGESPTRGPSRTPSARSWCSQHEHGASTVRVTGSARWRPSCSKSTNEPGQQFR